MTNEVAKVENQATEQEILTPEKIQELINNGINYQENVRRYPPELKIMALALRINGKTYKEIMKILGVKSESTIYDWIRDQENDTATANEMANNIKDNIGNKLLINAATTLNSIDDRQLQGASLSQKGVFTGIMLDKYHQLQDRNTFNRETVTIQISRSKDKEQTLQEQLDSLENELEQLSVTAK